MATLWRIANKMLNYETSCINVQIKGIFKYYKFITSWKRLKYSTQTKANYF